MLEMIFPMNRLTLCMPFNDTSCFRCCPPIRPAGYDHLIYFSSLKREFLENRRRWLAQETPRYRPVVGFWCWGLGYIDPDLRIVGCLLHPEQNGGVDLRDFTGYRAKCARELCYEAQQFLLLSEEAKLFWRSLARGLSSFYFSSPRSNPLFHLLRWGPHVLEFFRCFASERSWTVTELVWHFPFLMDNELEPRAWRFPVEIAIQEVTKQNGLEDVYWSNFFPAVMKRWTDMSAGKIFKFSHPHNGPYVHSLNVKDSLKDFIRFFLGISKMHLSQVLALEEILRQVILETLENCLRCNNKSGEA